MQRVVHLAKSAYIGVDGESQVVRQQALEFFIEGLRDWDIKMAVMKDDPQTLEAVYQKAISELKWKIRLDVSTEYDDEPMEVCHSRRRVQTEDINPDEFERDKDRRNEKSKRSTNGSR